MVWNRTDVTQAMPGAPELFQKWDQFFYVHEQQLTWRDSGIPLHVIPFVSSVLYIWMVYQLPGFLMNRPALRKSIQGYIKPLMIMWNLFLCILSVFMFVGIGVPAAYVFMREGAWEIVCNPDENVIPPSTYTYITVIPHAKKKILPLFLVPSIMISN